jgi:hypothetical protein
MRAFVATRRGRPRKLEAANDNEPDRGTAELQLKRADLARGVGAEAVAHPLDLLLAHGFIETVEQRAGLHYAALYRRVIGRTEMSYGRLYAGLAGEARGRAIMPIDAASDEADLAAAQVLFRAAQAMLRQEGAVIAGLTERLAVFGAFPDWLLATDAMAARERGLLRRGLQRLAEAFRHANRAADNRIAG